MKKPHLVVTSIQPPNEVMRTYASECRRRGFEFIVVGDTKSPRDFDLPGCRFIPYGDAIEREFAFAAACPGAHYARKNIGYLVAMGQGADLIVETDDDNAPQSSFWAERQVRRQVPSLDAGGWVNVYGYFSETLIWPRGLPLDCVRVAPPALAELPLTEALCPIQQGLADNDPDVDAVYRLLMELPVKFSQGIDIALGAGTWCPFNSQNTAWWPEAFPLLYLPSCCSIRMTDTWRSFVAQRIAWANGWRVLFHSPTVAQERNEHNLMSDFEQELPGYLGNARMASLLSELPIEPGPQQSYDNLRRCYAALVEHKYVDRAELPLLELWIDDCRRLLGQSRSDARRPS